MRTRVQKWGNSLAVRIPTAFAREAELEQDAAVELLLDNGTITLTRARSPRLTLAELLSGVCDANLHSEVESGPAAGNEVW